MFVRSGEIPSPAQTSIDKTNDYAMKSERGTLVWGSNPLVTVFTKRPVMGGGRRPGVCYKHIWALLFRKQATKILHPSPMAKNRPFFRFGRRALDAAGNFSPPRPRIHLISSRPCPTRTGLAVVCFYVEIEGLSSRELFLISVLTIFNVKAQVPPRTAA